MAISKFVIEKRNHLFKYVRARAKEARKEAALEAMTIILYYIVSL